MRGIARVSRVRSDWSGQQRRQRRPEIRDVFAPHHQLLPQVLCHGQGVRMPHALQFGPQRGRVLLRGYRPVLRSGRPGGQQRAPARRSRARTSRDQPKALLPQVPTSPTDYPAFELGHVLSSLLFTALTGSAGH
ncbi:hypothetical protein GCM10010518_54710 [Kitasatospora cinereorecta]